MSSHTGPKPSEASILGEDGKLSSASAATSLKYAKPQDLPSYPSTGGVQLSAAGAAASLASSNQKTFEHWKPEAIPAANRAALLAKDAKVDAIWKPEASMAGSKAAMLAHANPTQVEPMQPKKPATNKTTSNAYDTAEDTHRKAMMAATAASHNRRQSDSTPTETNVNPASSAGWAMKAANKSHRDAPASTHGAFTTGDPGFEAARIQNVAKNNVDRQLYGSNPPVAIEVEERNRQDTLRASAVAMAQKMYAIQQKHIDDAAGSNHGQALAASRARTRSNAANSDTSKDELASSGGGYENLEEAARRLAQERLAKIHDEHAEYRSYYGQTSPPKQNRLSMRLRGRAASQTADDDSDEEQSRRIKSQMSIFQTKLAEVDTKKRQQDRDALLEIAHRNVDAQISKMDTKVFEETGKASPAQMEKWQKAAREKAQRDSDERMQHTGKVHIGGGKYLDQSELDAIARARLQPTLDDISDKAEKQRAKDEEERLDRERKLEMEQRDKARAADTAAEIKALAERQKQEAKAAKDEQRKQEAEEKLRKREEAQVAKERARLEKEEKRKSRDPKSGLVSSIFGRGGGAATATTTETTPESAAPATEIATPVVATTTDATYHDQVTSPTADSGTPVVVKLEPATSSPADTQLSKAVEVKRDSVISKDTKDETSTPQSPPTSKVKSWMRQLRGKSEVPQEDEKKIVKDGEKDAATTTTADKTLVPTSDSMKDVAMAGRTETNETDDMYAPADKVSPERSPVHHDADRESPSISSVSSRGVDHEYTPPTNFALGTTEPTAEDEREEKQGLKSRLLKKIKPSKGGKEKDAASPLSATNATDDEFEEARDHFDEQKLAPPPPLSTIAGEGTRTLSPKGSREGSRFTEQL